MSYTYEYPRPMVTVDVILISKKSDRKLLLIKRKNDPYKNTWALPGGFVELNEELHEAAQRELMEETSVEIKNLNQFKTYGTLGRDPRGRTISVIYFGFIDAPVSVKADDDAADAAWFAMNDLPELAFDHKHILDDFLKLNHH